MSSRPDAVPATSVIREAIDLARLPWIRPLVGAYANDFPSVAPLFAGDPKDPAAWRDAIRRVQQAPRDSMPTCRALARQLERRGAPPAAKEAAAKLAHPATVAIVTGQQAGAFGGPLYTLLKAATTIQLARKVSAEHGVMAVPIFWVDAEDHDWDEVRTAQILNRDLALAEVSLGASAGDDGRPVAARVLDDRVEDTLGALEVLLPPTEFTADVLVRLRRHYRAGASVATAFAGWIEDLLGASGLIVFEAADPEAKPAVADLFAKELQQPCTARLARLAAETMRRLGHSPQVEPPEGSVAVFYLDAAGRSPIKRRGDDGYLIGDRPRSAADLSAEARAHPERFSPNVLLRPLVQDRLFPTVCYVAGPAELAYQAQLRGVYQEFGVEPPLLYPRASATLLDSSAARFLDRHNLPIEQLQAQDESALNRLLEAQLPASVGQVITNAERYLVDQADELKPAVAAIDPTLAGAVETTIERVRETFAHLQGKIVQASKRKDQTLRRQFERARALAFPGGEPQERGLNVVAFVNRYGPALGERLVEVLPLETDKHYVLTL